MTLTDKEDEKCTYEENLEKSLENSPVNTSDMSHDSESNVSLDHYTVNIVSDTDTEIPHSRVLSRNSKMASNEQILEEERPLSVVAPPIKFHPLPSTGLQTFVYVI